MLRLLESEAVVVEQVSDATIYNGDLWAQLCLRLGLLSRDHVRTLMGLYLPQQFQTAL